MRVIAGVAKGRTIQAPRGMGTRPSTDRVRSAAFSILESLQPDWSRVLDLYAGSGALGLEALSRGAEHADFVEQDRQACTVIKHNLEEMGFSSQGHVYCSKVSRALSFLEGTYGMIFLDPPYADESLPSTLHEVAASNLVGKDTAIVVLHSSRRSLDHCFGSACRVKERRHGDTSISVYRQEATA